MEFRKRFGRKRPGRLKLGQWHFHQDNTPVSNSILVTDYLTQIGIKTVPQPPYIPDLAPCDFWSFLKLRCCRYETIEEMKEAVTKVLDALTQEDFDGAFHKLLERYNKEIAARGDYSKGPIRKKSGNLFNDPCVCVYIYIYYRSEVWNLIEFFLNPKNELIFMFLVKKIYFFFVCFCYAII